MVYLMYEDIGWIPYVKSWIDRLYKPDDDANYIPVKDDKKLDQELREHLFSLFEKSIDDFLELKHTKLTEPINTVDL